MILTTAEPPTFLDGAPVVADIIRVFIIFTGFTLALLTLKASLRAARFRDWERAFGSLAFALIVVTPSITGLYRFNEPLVLWTTITYVSGLTAGVVAAVFRVSLRWRWWRRLIDRRREARRARPRR